MSDEMMTTIKATEIDWGRRATGSGFWIVLVTSLKKGEAKIIPFNGRSPASLQQMACRAARQSGVKVKTKMLPDAMAVKLAD